MKDITAKILEGKSGIYNEIQNEIDTNAAYHTLDISTGKSKYKKGFITFNADGEFVSIVAYNKLEDLVNLFNAEEEVYIQYDEIKIGECIDFKDNNDTTTQILRIW